MEGYFNSIKDALATTLNLSDCELVPLEESQKGEGVIAVINRVVLTGRDAKGETERNNVILKTAPAHEIYRSSSPIYEMYSNEVYAYTTVLPTLKQTFEQFGSKFVTFPRCYATNTKEKGEYLVFEDLKCEGYKLWEKQKVMDDDHIYLVLENLAKFHAPSIYLKTMSFETWQKLSEGFNGVQEKFFCETKFCDAIVDLAKTLDPVFEGRTDSALEIFTGFRDGELKKFMQDFRNKGYYDSVIVHGDLWCNNILFKYKDNKPIDLALLDFQATRISSIAVDLSYFLYVSSSKSTMASIESYIEHYYNKLAQNLRMMHLNPELEFPFSTAICGWKDFNKYGLCMALVALHGANSDSDEFPGLDEVLNGGKDFWYALNFESRHEKRYQERIKDVILHFIEKGYLSK